MKFEVPKLFCKTCGWFHHQFVQHDDKGNPLCVKCRKEAEMVSPDCLCGGCWKAWFTADWEN